MMGGYWGCKQIQGYCLNKPKFNTDECIGEVSTLSARVNPINIIRDDGLSLKEMKALD